MLPELAVSEDGEGRLASFDSQRQENPVEDEEPTRKVRGRTIKRRRRLRKRMRTTTEPPLDEQNENLNVAEQNPEVAYEPRVEEATASPPLEETTRRRQIKRRRRPQRKYQDVQQENQGYSETDGAATAKPPRRRRKGGRRRRPTTTTEPSKIELFIETTFMPPEAAEVTTATYEVEKVTEIPATERAPPQLPEIVEDIESVFQEEPDPQVYQVYDSRHNLVSQPTVELVEDGNEAPKYSQIDVREEPETEDPLYRPVIEVREPEEEPQLPDIYSTVAMPNNPSRLKPYSVRPAINTIKPVKEFIQESDPEQSEHHEERANKETNEVPSPTDAVTSQKEQDYGNKIFDRKELFSKSRRLPVTSAIIRKKLYPRQQNTQVQSESNPTNRFRDSSRNEVTEKQLIPEGFTIEPLTVEPSKLIERLKAHAQSYRTTTTALPTTIITTEEPNYPKFESKKEKYSSQTENVIKTTTELYKNRFNKVVELHRSRGKVILTTPQYENIQDQTTTNVQIVDVETTETAKVVDVGSAEEQTTIASEKPNSDDLNLNKINDSIVDLLRSESANMKLSEILESRNMTIAQLLEHRERGSSRFQLSDFFAEKKSLFGENSTASMNSDKVEIGTPLSVEKQTISFPSQDVLGSFPAFMSDKIEKGVKSKDDQPLTTRKSVHLENREPRVFDSMPEFINKKNGELPPWKVSNPRLRPVSVRGDFEEIKISLHPSENPKNNEVDNLLLSDDKAEVLRTNRVTSTLEADSVTSQDTAFGRFRKIPVTVKSAIIISIAILILAIFGFLSVLISCRLRQKKARLRAKQDILCEHLKNEDFMNSQQSLSPVLTKPSSRGAPPVFSQNQVHPSATNNRQYYLWRTLRKTFQYD
ncbi:hypothetical protein GE061_012353 [Apolygus lucorum]|uniref:Uncharacterized protein n=1 Tax=Apolygus lucorum TaxID=248454 RepID=A0A6A4JKT5_APOLU|nr:hypothetical protein GE061_012353 [Apolygus lucorum]